MKTWANLQRHKIDAITLTIKQNAENSSKPGAQQEATGVHALGAGDSPPGGAGTSVHLVSEALRAFALDNLFKGLCIVRLEREHICLLLRLRAGDLAGALSSTVAITSAYEPRARIMCRMLVLPWPTSVRGDRSS